VAICDVLGVSMSQILLVAEARHSGLAVEWLFAFSNKQFRTLLASGLRGQRADATRDETVRLQANGLSKADIATRLGVTVRTVERYWVKPAERD
jgi:DNA-binding NarL/FixJ family response regulator